MRTPRLHIVADENIAGVEAAFGDLGATRLEPGDRITPAILDHANVLLVRSVTRVDAELVRNSSLRFVGSATIGTDHIDLETLRRRDIAFAHAPGSNAESVVEYVLAALLALARRHGEPLRGKTLGIIGCGNIGKRLLARTQELGIRTLACDPPLARAGGQHAYLSLDAVLSKADIVTLHVPLIREGPDRTVHLLNQAALRLLKPGAWLINTSRGRVVCGEALKHALEEGHIGAAVLDVWETEPVPDPALLRLVDVATPHIAGYSADGKLCGTAMLHAAVLKHFGLASSWTPDAELPPVALTASPGATFESEVAWLDKLVRMLYDIRQDDARLRASLKKPSQERAPYFSELRKSYPRRRAFTRHVMPRLLVPEPLRAAVARGLGVRLVDQVG